MSQPLIWEMVEGGPITLSMCQLSHLDVTCNQIFEIHFSSQPILYIMIFVGVPISGEWGSNIGFEKNNFGHFFSAVNPGVSGGFQWSELQLKLQDIISVHDRNSNQPT